MLKLFAPRRSLPAGRTVAVAIVAVIAMAGVSRLHTHPTNEAAKLIAGAPQGPELDAEHRHWVRGNLLAIPLAFEVNKGQVDPRAR